ncbi:VC0807 family protein [Kitasatospora kifunensis]|uniref:Intracellular septation protein A n=1 Tax=Kitasatospora kifunensis TaxID=58351 RepID=A0A7W7VW62_KITKI|nr:VC0807 family protein [Kitasatospora kifunensis]MBB4924374.1 intracellular septation protein A [Kitasatospora kifunensis]
MSSTTSPPAPARKQKAAAIGWLLTIGFNVVAPILIHNFAHAHGASEFTAILLSGLGPVADTAVYLAWHRRVDEFAVISLIFLALSGVAALVGPHDAKLLLAKDSLVTGLFGLVLLASLVASRPMMFYFGRKFATDGTQEQVAWWNGLWQFEGFRRVQRNLTIGWGIGFVIEAVLRVVFVYSLSNGQALAVNNVLPYAFTGGLIFWTMKYARRAQARGRALGAPEAPAAAGAL